MKGKLSFTVKRHAYKSAYCLFSEKPVPVALYAVIDSFHDIREDQMVRFW